MLFLTISKILRFPAIAQTSAEQLSNECIHVAVFVAIEHVLLTKVLIKVYSTHTVILMVHTHIYVLV